MSQILSIPPRPQSAHAPLDLDGRLARAEAALADLGGRFPGRRANKLSMVAFSGSLDGILAAMTIATGAATQDTEVHVFFTFWATAALRRAHPPSRARAFMDRMLGWMLPRGEGALRLSRMNYGGAGTAMMRQRMGRRGVADVPALLDMAAVLGVRIHVCEMSMNLLGMSREDLIDYPELAICGVSSFMEHAQESATTLFI